MKLSGRTNSNFEPAPEGTQQGVLVDIIDRGFQPDKFNPGQTRHEIQLAFQTEEEMADGRPYVVKTYPMTASLNSKAKLFQTIGAMRGKIQPEELDENGDFDLDGLIGTNCLITIQHTTKDDGRVFANVTGVAPLPKKTTTRLEPRDYVRVQDREPQAQAAAAGAASGGTGEDEIPF